MKRKKKLITYWTFTIEITGPRYQTRAERRRLSFAKLREQIREVARLGAKSKLPAGFRAKVY